MDDIHEDDENLGTNRFPVRHVLGKSAQTESKDYSDPPPGPLFEFKSWSFRRAGVAELIATIWFLYITVLTVMRVLSAPGKCASVGIQGSAWAFGGIIFARLLHCRCFRWAYKPRSDIWSFLARKLSLTRAIYYIIMQCLRAICGAAVVKGYNKVQYNVLGGGDNVVNPGCSKGDSLGAEIVGTFVLVYTVFFATDAKRSAKDSHVPMLAPLPIGFVVFLVLLASISITGTGINSTRSLGTAIIYNNGQAWEDHVGPFIGAALAALYHRIVIRAIPFKNKA